MNLGSAISSHKAQAVDTGLVYFIRCMQLSKIQGALVRNFSIRRHFSLWYSYKLQFT